MSSHFTRSCVDRFQVFSAGRGRLFSQTESHPRFTKYHFDDGDRACCQAGQYVVVLTYFQSGRVSNSFPYLECYSSIDCLVDDRASSPRDKHDNVTHHRWIGTTNQRIRLLIISVGLDDLACFFTLTLSDERSRRFRKEPNTQPVESRTGHLKSEREPPEGLPSPKRCKLAL